MAFIQSKIYYDGSHYIAIPQGSYPSGKGCKKQNKAIPTPEQIDLKEKFETAYAESKKLPYKQRDEFLDERFQDAITDNTKRKDFITENKDSATDPRSILYCGVKCVCNGGTIL